MQTRHGAWFPLSLTFELLMSLRKFFFSASILE